MHNMLPKNVRPRMATSPNGHPNGHVPEWPLNNLRSLTRDNLTVDNDDNGNWVVKVEKVEGDKLDVGTNLIRRLDTGDGKGYTCLIKIKEGKNAANPIVMEHASNVNIGTGGIVYFDPYNSPAVYTERLDENGDLSIHNEKIPTEILLGHELIHVLRFMGGNYIAEGAGEYKYKEPDGWVRKGNIKTELARMEELSTTGISYLRPDGSYADAANWTTTENALRKEHGYGRRVRYAI